MNRQVLLALAVLAVSTLLACSRGESGTPTGAAGGAAAAGAGGTSTAGQTAGAIGTAGAPPDGGSPDAAPSADAELPPDATCLQVRNCAAACPDDACIRRCEDHGSSAARALHEQLRACSLGACPAPQDETCRCQAECIFPGACADLQDTCAEGMADPACTKCL